MGGSGHAVRGWPRTVAFTVTFTGLSLLLIGWALWSLVGFQHPDTLDIVAALILLALPPTAGLVYLRRHRVGAEVSAQQATQRFSAIAAACTELLWETKNGRIAFIGPTVVDYLGYQAEELIGQPAAMIFADFDRPRVQELVRTSAQAAQGWRNQEYTFRTKNQELRHFLSNGYAETDAEGTVVGFAGSIRPLDSTSGRRQIDRRRRYVQHIIDEQKLEAFFQAIVDTDSGTIIGAEALSRFPLAEPPMPPDKWFAVAADVGLGVELELVAVLNALQTATVAFPDHLYLSVNVSPATLLAERLGPVLEQSGWDPARLVVEITEHVSVDNYELLGARTEALRARGLRLAVDDAGAGYASFRHILALTPDYIKLDRGLISDLDSDPGKRALVKAVTTFAADIGASVIVEGIETTGELAAARALGVQGAQGYLIAKPMRLSDWPPENLQPPTRTAADPV